MLSRALQPLQIALHSSDEDLALGQTGRQDAGEALARETLHLVGQGSPALC